MELIESLPTELQTLPHFHPTSRTAKIKNDAQREVRNRL